MEEEKKPKNDREINAEKRNKNNQKRYENKISAKKIYLSALKLTLLL